MDNRARRANERCSKVRWCDSLAHDFLKVRSIAAALILGFASSLLAIAQQDSQLDQLIKSIAAAHHGHVAIYAHNLRTGQTASLLPDEPVQTASVIKMGVLFDAAEQVRAGQVTFDERILLTKANQVESSGVLGELTPPIALTFADVLKLMVILSDNTATIWRLTGLVWHTLMKLCGPPA